MRPVPSSLRPALAALGALLALGTLPAAAQLPHTENTLTRDPDRSRPSATIADAAWLVGRWEGTGLGSAVEESWLPPAGGTMSAVFRLSGEGGPRFYELMTIREDEEGSLTFDLKHFGPDLVGWEEREETQRFPLVAKDPRTLWFDGMTIQRDGGDGMRIWVALGDSDGDTTEGEFVYRRVP